MIEKIYDRMISERMQIAERFRSEGAGEAAKIEPIRNREDVVGRNDPCPCGSGKKYKNCHMRNSGAA